MSDNKSKAEKLADGKKKVSGPQIALKILPRH